MTFRVQGTIEINGAQAKAEAKAVAGELKKVGTDATGMATASRGAAEAAGRLEAGAANAATDLRALAAAERQAAADAIQMGRNSGVAAGQIGSLTAQFNDIGVMLAAGQNPLQLAIQQGTQITQVFGNMGAGAAVRALGQAFLSMLSPLNLITIGSIAAGAALFQWLMDGEEEVQSLDDALQALADSGDAVAKANRRAGASTAELREEFGAAAQAARDLLREEAALERQRSERQGRAVSGAVQQELGLFLSDSRFATGNQVELADIFGLNIWQSESRQAINDVIAAFRQLDTARGLEGQIAAAERLREVFRSAAQASGELSAQEADALQAINTLILDRQRLLQQERAAQAALAEANGRYPGIEAAKEALDYRLAEEVAVRQAASAARELIGEYQTQAQINEQIAIFGRDSWLVAQSRLAVERESVAAMLEAEGITGALADQVLAAWDNAEGFNAAGAVMATVLAEAHDAMMDLVAAAPGGGWLAGAISEAAALAGQLWDGAKAAAAFENAQKKLARDGKVYSGRGGDPRSSNQEGYGRFTYSGPSLDANNVPVVRGGTGRSGGAKAAREERDAVADLIEKLRAEIELEAELDPVKREMIRYREELKDATAAERAEVEALIAQREREKAVTESLQWVGEQSGDALVDALMGASDAGERLIDTLKRAVLQALLLGTGPLAGLMGGGGGLLSGLLDIPDVGVITFAQGGLVLGPGGPTDDKVPARLSAGEFVVNAAATRRNLPLLEEINAARGFARGGQIEALDDAEPAPAMGRIGRLYGIGLGATLFADSGLVLGDGGPTDDKVPARLSAGEFVVNAAATRRNLPLLEEINAARGFARGGQIEALDDAEPAPAVGRIGRIDGIGLGATLFADSGLVLGDGGPTDDKVPARLSAGEFVVNAAATRRNRRLLEAVNAAPGYAAGGMIGGTAGATGGAIGTVTNHFSVDARGSNDPAAVEMAARRGMQKALDEFRRGQLPSDIRRSLDNPRVTRF